MKSNRKWKPCADEAEVIARTCTSKKRFNSEFLARSGAARHVYRSTLDKRAKRLWVYSCKFCSGWHLTSRPGGSQPVEV